MLHEQEIEKMLIVLLTHDDPNVQVAAAQGLGVMSENLICREAIGQWGELLDFWYPYRHNTEVAQ